MSQFELPSRPGETSAPTPTAKAPRRGGVNWPLILIAVAVVAAGVYFGSGFFGGGAVGRSPFQTEKVARRDLRVVITAPGNVESAANIDLKCRVDGGSQILWIIPDGTVVKRGEKLVSLSSAAIDEKVNAQQILVERGEATVFTAAEDLAVAEIALKEYLDGTFVKELQTAESAIVVQEQNVKTSENLLAHSEMMFRKGHINQLQLEANRDSVARAKLDLEASKTARKVLVDFTKPKMMKQLESARDAAKSKLEAEKRAFKLEKDKLARLMEQKSYCTIMAPQDGTVIYANDGGFRRESQAVIEEGAAIKEFQTILRLPDLTKMQVKAMVHETKIGRVFPNMPAVVKIRDYELRGKVTQVMSQAESRNWFSSVKEYATFVSIDGAQKYSDLKPNMTAEVSILVKETKNALSVPLQAVVEKGGKFYGYVLAKNSKGYAERALLIGDNNDKHIQIKDGLNEGDDIILNPRANCEEAREAMAAPDATADLQPLPGVPTDTGGGEMPGAKGRKGGGKGGPPGEGMPGMKGGPGGGKKFDPSKMDPNKARKAPDGQGPQADGPKQKTPAGQAVGKAA